MTEKFQIMLVAVVLCFAGPAFISLLCRRDLSGEVQSTNLPDQSDSSKKTISDDQ